jgi:hypothetical protein
MNLRTKDNTIVVPRRRDSDTICLNLLQSMSGDTFEHCISTALYLTHDETRALIGLLSTFLGAPAPVAADPDPRTCPTCGHDRATD